MTQTIYILGILFMIWVIAWPVFVCEKNKS